MHAISQLVQIAPAGQLRQTSLFSRIRTGSQYSDALTPEVEDMLKRNCVVAVDVSGGGDSPDPCDRRCMLPRLHHGHTGPRHLIYSGLGSVEWKESLPTCERLAAHFGWELVITRSQMAARWSASPPAGGTTWRDTRIAVREADLAHLIQTGRIRSAAARDFRASVNRSSRLLLITCFSQVLRGLTSTSNVNY